MSEGGFMRRFLGPDRRRHGLGRRISGDVGAVAALGLTFTGADKQFAAQEQLAAPSTPSWDTANGRAGSYVITTTRTDRNGDYRVVIKADRRGLLTIRDRPGRL
jgi:hypothetical protein